MSFIYKLLITGESNMEQIDNEEYKIGRFFIENGIINEAQLQEALELQVDNKERLLGEILVTLGYLSKDELIMALEMFMMMTDSDDLGINEWLDQDEIDMIIKKLDASKSKNT
jgi:hypothetical protein